MESRTITLPLVVAALILVSGCIGGGDEAAAPATTCGDGVCEDSEQGACITDCPLPCNVLCGGLGKEEYMAWCDLECNLVEGFAIKSSDCLDSACCCGIKKAPGRSGSDSGTVPPPGRDIRPTVTIESKASTSSVKPTTSLEQTTSLSTSSTTTTVNDSDIRLTYVANATCFDGIANQREEGVDCGGPCEEPCGVTCHNDTECGDVHYNPSICREESVFKVLVSYTCDDPGTPESSCKIKRDYEFVEKCLRHKPCTEAEFCDITDDVRNCAKDARCVRPSTRWT